MDCRQSATPLHLGGWAGAAWLALLAGCAATPEVQTLATGRSDVSAYSLNGSDLDELRREAGRLCPLGGEVLRQSSQGAPPSGPAEGVWRRALQATALWLDPPLRSAQLVVQCREAGDRMRLAPAATSAATTAAAPGAAARPPAAVADAGSNAPTGASSDLGVALPVGPVTPEW